MSGGRGSHSGSGTRNDIPAQLSQVDALYQQTLGRTATQAEKDFLVNWISDQYSAVDLAKLMMQQASQNISQIQSAATSYGFNLTPEQARDIYSQSQGAITTDIRGDKTGFDSALNRIGIAYANKQKDPTKDPFTGARISTAQYDNDVKAIFQNTLGRDPTQYELEHFGGEMLSGKDLYDLQSFLTSTPDYMEKKLADSRSQMNDELLRQEEETFQRAAPQIISSYMKAGRLGSSSLDAAIANSRRDLASQRQAMIGSMAYGTSQDAVARAFQNYAEQNAPYAANRMAAWQNAYQLPLQYAQQNQQRAWDLQDYNRQQSDYDRYMNQMMRGQDRAGLWGLAGQVASGSLQGLGSYFGGRK